MVVALYSWQIYKTSWEHQYISMASNINIKWHQETSKYIKISQTSVQFKFKVANAKIVPSIPMKWE